MLCLNTSYVACCDLCLGGYNNHDGSCSFTSMNAENKLYLKGLYPTASVNID